MGLFDIDWPFFYLLLRTFWKTNIKRERIRIVDIFNPFLFMVIKLTVVFQLFLFFLGKKILMLFFLLLLLVLQGCQEHNPVGERINGCIYFNCETYIIICVIVLVFVLIPSFCCVLFVCVIQIGSRLSLRRNSGVKDNKFGVDAQALMLKGVKEAYLCYQGHLTSQLLNHKIS